MCEFSRLMKREIGKQNFFKNSRRQKGKENERKIAGKSDNSQPLVVSFSENACKEKHARKLRTIFL